MTIYFLLQEATARLIEAEISRLHESNCSFVVQSADFTKKRDIFLKFLVKAGLSPIKPMGGYFIVTDISKIGM